MSNEQWKMNDDDVQMPLGTGGDTASESPADEPKKSRISSSVLLLIGVFGAGLLLVFVLGKQAVPREATAEQQTKDAQFQASLEELAQKSGKPNASAMDTDTLMKLFQSGGPAKPKDIIPGNPFELPRSKGAEPVAAPPIPVKVVEDPLEAQRLLRISDGLRAMKLQTIMYSKEQSTSAALVGKDFVKVGSKLGEFTVVDIQPDRVILEANGEKYPLTLATKTGAKEQ
jgi:hypothetical protein